MYSYVFRSSYGGLGYESIMKMNMADILEFNSELSNIIRLENNASK